MADRSLIITKEINGDIRDQLHEDLDKSLTPELIKIFNNYVGSGLDTEELLVCFKISASQILKEFEEKKLYLNSVVGKLK